MTLNFTTENIILNITSPGSARAKTDIISPSQMGLRPYICSQRGSALGQVEHVTPKTRGPGQMAPKKELADPVLREYHSLSTRSSLMDHIEYGFIHPMMGGSHTRGISSGSLKFEQGASPPFQTESGQLLEAHKDQTWCPTTVSFP